MSCIIVYVHGALSTKNSWNYIRQKFAEKRPDGEIIEEYIRYDLNKELSPDIVSKMVDRVGKLLTKNVVEKLIFIGHSFGGVLSVATARELKAMIEEKKIKTRIITLSAPFGGSEIAATLRIFRPGSLFFKNVGTHSDFVKDFKAKPLPFKTHVFVTTEGGADWMSQANDGVVTVESQTWFSDDPLANHQEIKVNHFEILLADQVVTQLVKSAS